MDARTQELLDRLVAVGQFPNMSASEGHELHEGVTDELDDLNDRLQQHEISLWSEEPPNEQAWYWHWNGNPDDAPFIYSVLISGTNMKCFVAGSIHSRAPWCTEVGGWWKKIVSPALPNAH